jgi:hypothetical protein
LTASATPAGDPPAEPGAPSAPAPQQPTSAPTAPAPREPTSAPPSPLGHQAAPPDAPPVSFEEFRLYHATTEQVTDRRLAMNRWNYSVLVATLLAIGAVLTWGTSRPTNALVGAGGVVVLSTMAILLCTYWIHQITDFKMLNNAKFKVLNEMAPLVIFDGPDGVSPARSYRPFEREWQDLQERQAVSRVQTGRLHMLALNSSGAEYFIPRAFRILFAAILLATLVFVVISHDVVLDQISPFDEVDPQGGRAP